MNDEKDYSVDYPDPVEELDAENPAPELPVDDDGRSPDLPSAEEAYDLGDESALEDEAPEDEPAEADEFGGETAGPASEDEPAEGEVPAEAETAEADPETEEDVPAGELRANGMRVPKPYHEHAYMLYGGAPAAEELDLKGTSDFLKLLGFDGGELLQARMGKEFAERMNASESDDENKSICAYCGCEITGVDYARLPDGRLRCTTCSRTLVRSKEELTEIFKRVLDHLEALFGAIITVPINVDMLEERKLKKRAKCPVCTIDNNNILILGVAIQEKDKKTKKKIYTVCLENGAPRICAIATFAHELTHIWQYTHWDNEGKGRKKGLPKLPKKLRLILYEGMAKWVEIQYLYLIGETEVARREEEYTLTRKDEYGIGFKLFLDSFPLSKDTMVCDETPFTPDRYPIS